MVQCPICRRNQVVFVVGPRRTRCPYCGASWVQDDSQQMAVDPSDSRVPSQPAPLGAAAP